jgi:lipoate-protein ligase A
MRVDVELLHGIERGDSPPTLRFYRFKEPTVSYGRLQKLTDITPRVPAGWKVVQRPTGGGVVFHDGDFCLSLCWPAGERSMPRRPQEQYRWIHSIILESLSSNLPVQMATCARVPFPEEPFSSRTCFKNPVGYDLMWNGKKIVGGALRCTREATLYQGSVQITVSPAQESHLLITSQTRLYWGS